MDQTPKTQLSEKEIRILVKTLLGEGVGEGTEGMQAIMNVIMNRAADARFSNNPALVAIQANTRGTHAFSAWNNPTVGPMAYYSESSPQYKTAEKIVRSALAGELPDKTRGAINYYANKGPNAINAPSWFDESATAGTVQIGNHVFGARVPAGEKTAQTGGEKTTQTGRANAAAENPVANLAAVLAARGSSAVRPVNADTDPSQLYGFDFGGTRLVQQPTLEQALQQRYGNYAVSTAARENYAALGLAQTMEQRVVAAQRAGLVQDSTPDRLINAGQVLADGVAPHQLNTRKVALEPINPATANPYTRQELTQLAADTEAARLRTQQAPNGQLGVTRAQQDVIAGGYYALHPDERPPITVAQATQSQLKAIRDVSMLNAPTTTYYDSSKDYGYNSRTGRYEVKVPGEAYTVDPLTSRQMNALKAIDQATTTRTITTYVKTPNPKYHAVGGDQKESHGTITNIQETEPQFIMVPKKVTVKVPAKTPTAMRPAATATQILTNGVVYRPAATQPQAPVTPPPPATLPGGYSTQWLPQGGNNGVPGATYYDPREGGWVENNPNPWGKGNSLAGF